MRLFLHFSIFLLSLLMITAITAAGNVPNFKKMKVKELKTWMKERSLSCPDCADKESLIEFCTKTAATTVPKVTRPQKPNLPFWDAWSNNAKEICEEHVTKKSLDNAGHKVCESIVVATDAFFMQYGKRTASKLRKTTDAMLKTSYGDIYYGAGRRLFTKLIKYCLSAENIKSCSSSSNVQKLMEEESVPGAPFVLYITNIGIENTNPMYDILKDKKGIESDEL